MCLFVVQIFECKSELNKRLLHLRDWKLEIIEGVVEYTSVCVREREGGCRVEEGVQMKTHRVNREIA